MQKWSVPEESLGWSCDRSGAEHFAYFARQIVGREGLLKKVMVPVQQAAVQEGTVGVSREEQHAQIWPHTAHELSQLRTIHFGHHHVGHHEMHRTFLFAADFEGFDAVPSLQDFVA